MSLIKILYTLGGYVDGKEVFDETILNKRRARFAHGTENR